MTVQEFVNIDKDLQIVQDISDVNIIILIYLFIKHDVTATVHLHLWGYWKIPFNCQIIGNLLLLILDFPLHSL
jgi:hypothetical protein